MHESSLINGLMEQIYDLAAQNNARKVVALKVRLGALAHISPQHFREHFEIAAKGGLAENANLQIEVDRDEKNEAALDLMLESVDIE